MIKTDSLYMLIKSLTKTEKSYFKKYASRHVLGSVNKYSLLFDAIAANKNGYNDDNVKKKFRNEKFIKNFPVMKNYLSNMILKSLNSYYSDTTPDNQIKNQLRYIKILYKKALFHYCKKVLENSLKQAYRTDNFLAILELLSWKKNLINEYLYTGNVYENLEAAYKEEQNIIGKLKNLSDYRMLSYRARSLSVGYNPHYKGSEVKEALLNILKEPILQSEKEALSFPAIITYYHVLASVYESLNKNIEAFECKKRLISIMENNSETYEGNITNYIISVFNLLSTCTGLKLFNELENYIGKLRTVGKKYSNKISENDRLLIYLGTSIFELKANISIGEFSRINGNILKLEKEFEIYGKELIKSDLLHCYYMVAYSLFGTGKYNESLKWVNKILNDKEAEQDIRLLMKSKILNIIIHYELENYELLEYLIKSAYRYFRRISFNNNEKLIIEFFKKLPAVYNHSQLIELFKESLYKLKSDCSEAKAENVFEVQNNFTNSAEIDYESWLESKISGIRFEEIVREKYANENIKA